MCWEEARLFVSETLKRHEEQNNWLIRTAIVQTLIGFATLVVGSIVMWMLTHASK